MKTAVVAGGTGLIGRNLLDLLLDDNRYDKVVSIGRKKIDLTHPKLEQQIVDFDKLDEADLAGDDVFCCLGTTIKKAGTQANFRKVDFNYPHNLAEKTLEDGASSFLLVSSIGADPESKIFYNRIKGETEDVITQFKFKTTHIFRPSILLGARPEFRFGETLGKAAIVVFGPLLFGPFKNYRAVKGSSVAAAMLYFAIQPEQGLFIHESAEIQQY